ARRPGGAGHLGRARRGLGGRPEIHLGSGPDARVERSMTRARRMCRRRKPARQTRYARPADASVRGLSSTPKAGGFTAAAASADRAMRAGRAWYYPLTLASGSDPRHESRVALLGPAARLDGFPELLDGILERLLLEHAPQEARDPEPDVDRLCTGRRGAAGRRLEAVGALHVFDVALDETPAGAARPIVRVLERVAHGLDLHVERHGHASGEPVGVPLEHATLRDGRGPVGVRLEVGEHGEAVLGGGDDHGGVRLAVVAHAWCTDDIERAVATSRTAARFV